MYTNKLNKNWRIVQIVFQDSVFKLMQFLYTLNHRYRYSNIFSAMLYRTLCIVRAILVLALPSSWIQHLSDLFFGCFLCPTREFFTHMETSPLPVKGCKFWQVYARHLWPLSSEDSLPCHIYCDTGHPFIMVVRDTYCRAFGNGDVRIWTYHVSVFTIL